MATSEVALESVRVHARNIGGIDRTEVDLSPGVTLLRGRNATHRSSFLQAIMVGLGSTRPSLKGDADEGEVTVDIDGERYSRTLKRRDGTVVFEGEPYLDDPTAADLFAFLLGDNEARSAVARGEDLREVIMRPIDVDAIEAAIEERTRERNAIDDRIAELEGIETELPRLESDRAALRERLNEKRAELEEVEEAIERADADIEESRERREEIDDAFETVRRARSELEDLRFERSTEEATVEELEAERAELEAELEAFDVPETDPDRIEDRIGELRERKRDLDDTLGELRSVISFNEDMLADGPLDVDLADGGDADGGEGDGGDGGGGDVTDALVTNADRTVCWSCGSRVERTAIEETIERLRSLHEEKLSDRNELQTRIDELSERRSAVLDRTREIDEAEGRLADVIAELERCHDRIDELEAEIDEKEAEIETLESEARDTGGPDYDEVIRLHRDATELELEIDRIETEMEEVDDEIDEAEAAIEERDRLEDERETLTEELVDLRTRVDRIEADAVESFNEHMAAVLDILEYDNIERIWIERRELNDTKGSSAVRTESELHVVRSNDEGASYQDSVAHLSESERAVTGLVFALAGYLAHEVYEDIPFVLLDSLEVIDSDRIARVVEYFEEYAEHLVVALLPEDAAALDDGYDVVSDI
ncbi:AAA domain-containing protein [Halorubrum aquaticum]|uniref:AAA domain-containing protein n=1 Tax=Halorubrum aquaticum TaxID=387340 RepID=A0A1I3B883_9EURY|nr:archaea-specific SMC-related protein [Halorubrum aquaticum]SFH58513.1 AAA domain-containing protein [Halorubrum aquaticum]